MYGFTNILYGTWLASNLVASGVLDQPLWFERTNRQVSARDFIELWQGTVERSLATRTSAGTNAPHAVSNVWYTWEQDTALPTNLHWYSYSGTNTTAEHYLTRTATNWDVHVNTARLNQVFGVPPPAVTSTWEFFAPSRFVWGAWDSVTIANCGSADLNGVYSYAFRTNGAFDQGWPLAHAVIWATIDVYTNGAYELYDYGPIHGSHGVVPQFYYAEWDSPVSYLIGQLLVIGDPSISAIKIDTECLRFSHGNWMNASNMTATPGPLRTNAIRESAVSRWLNLENAIGRATAAGLRQDPIQSGTRMRTAILTNCQALAVGAVSGYLDTTASSAGLYNGATNFPLQSATSLWTRLAIGTNPAALAWSSNAYDRVLQTNDYAEPYRVLAALSQTLRAAPAWAPPAGAAYNQILWTSGPKSTWAAAVAAVADSVTTSIVTGAPLCATYGSYDSDTLEPPYQAWAIARIACLVASGQCEAIAYVPDWYAFATNYNGGAWSAQGRPVSNAVYNCFASDPAQTRFTATSPPLGTLDFPADWCAEPTTASPRRTGIGLYIYWEDKGFQVVNQAAVLNWAFLYCTNGW